MADRRLAFALGTAHLLVLMTVLIALAYARGGLGAALGNVGTPIGLALGAWFWVVNVGAAYWVLRTADPRSAGPASLMREALLGGGLAGGAFLAGVIPFFFVPALPFVSFAVVALAAATAVGALVGALLAGVDALVLTAVRRVLTASSA